MLTFERQQLILDHLEEQGVAKLHELVDVTGASESTIRRDLTVLENERKLKRIHGGASRIQSKMNEPTFVEKQTRFTEEKRSIGQKAATFIQDGDCVYLDAGTTTQAMLPFITQADVTIVTNSLNIIEQGVRLGLTIYVIGGYVKSGTNAFIGKGAVDALQSYRFDKAFIGTNGVDLEFGYSTPDPEEAQVKKMAMDQANEAFVLSDASKFGESAFARFAGLKDATLITSKDEESDEFLRQLTKSEQIKVVTDDDLYGHA
ncbi:DeoR/GlpR family DNA-binding transcription regulator [Salisediminibacterium selenitireducens]|uniref:Transcriptional regulator, DeoR family n=1 Tax=Bacillus selenitireducens (strain ATCC 700615 / DSM 15326 / MLS10) TaxID=439292 RepID=D6Y060_BACIE|nr:DeoR/GlpR family DNA-binding transcription regulator [Salisediminibacterium selenitireducens]ADH98451.1 transcriptional regulator, DeoR family [[Bacillus] selenitireducens MLS10]